MSDRSSDYQKYCYNNEAGYAKNIRCYQNYYSAKIIREYIAGCTENKKILDVGCADGELLSELTKRHQIFGVDIAPNLLMLARKKGIKTKFADLEKSLPYQNSFFDILVVHHVLEHLVDTDKFLSECNRVLRNGGLLLLTFPNIATVLSLLLIIFDLPPYASARYRSLHFRDLTLKTTKLALMNNGFKIIRNFGGPLLPYPVLNSLSFLACLFPQLGMDLTILVQKIKTVKYTGMVYDFGLIPPSRKTEVY